MARHTDDVNELEAPQALLGTGRSACADVGTKCQNMSASAVPLIRHCTRATRRSMGSESF
ncbi:MAG: hypothetical protein MI923_00695 [Phycisphaerales bacterium]|nr:hypothetical protein [Phycisphaerales bacterium]